MRHYGTICRHFQEHGENRHHMTTFIDMWHHVSTYIQLVLTCVEMCCVDLLCVVVDRSAFVCVCVW